MLKRSVCWLLVLMTLLTALVGCGSGDEQADEQSSMLTEDNRQESSMVKQEEEVSQLTQTPAVGGEFKLAIENPTSLLPWQVTDEATGNLLMLIYSPLMEQKEDGTMLPCLAASKSWSAE